MMDTAEIEDIGGPTGEYVVIGVLKKEMFGHEIWVHERKKMPDLEWERGREAIRIGISVNLMYLYVKDVPRSVSISILDDEGTLIARERMTWKNINNYLATEKLSPMVEMRSSIGTCMLAWVAYKDVFGRPQPLHVVVEANGASIHEDSFSVAFPEGTALADIPVSELFKSSMDDGGPVPPMWFEDPARADEPWPEGPGDDEVLEWLPMAPPWGGHYLLLYKNRVTREDGEPIAPWDAIPLVDEQYFVENPRLFELAEREDDARGMLEALRGEGAGRGKTRR